MNEDLVIVASGDETLIAVAKSLLDEARIQYAVGSQYAWGRRVDTEIAVRHEDTEAASTLLTDLNKSSTWRNPYEGLPSWRKIIHLALVILVVGVLVFVAFLESRR